MSDVDDKTQEGVENKDEKDKEPGDEGKYASKDDLENIAKRVEEAGRKSEEVFKLITSEGFMNKVNPPPPPPTKVPEEKPHTAEEINDMSMSQGLTYMMKEVGKMVEKSAAKTDESVKNLAASIKVRADAEADREADKQIAQLKKDYGEDEYEKHRESMIKIVETTPGITANRAYLIAIGEEKPPKKEEVPKGTETEKSSQSAEFREADLTPEKAAEKAYVKNFGADENPI